MIRDNYLDINKIIKDKKILRLFRAVEAHGGVLRFVGGAVRDVLAGLKGFDLDLATDLSPDELVEACEEKGLRTVPIGIKFGTVGVIIDGDVVEVTSLRRDVKTDGRHAIVEFTDNWEVDASRRDLTINAVYADEKGNVFDYYNGIEDLENGVVRFIGKPEQRIKEDYLRILRFFRFYSIFSKTTIDAKALKACVENEEGLKNISVERVCDEFKKILLTPKVVGTLQIMFDNGILSSFFPKSKHMDSLDFMVKATDKLNLADEVLRRIFVLYMPDKELAENLAIRFRLTKKQKEAFIRLGENNPRWEDFFDKTALTKMVYKHGKAFCRDKFLISIATRKDMPENLKDKLSEIDGLEVPVFPIRGRDLITAGVENPHNISKILEALESVWINSNFSINRDEMLEQALKVSF